MKPALFRRLELWLVTGLFMMHTIQIVLAERSHSRRIFQTIEPFEKLRIAPRYDWVSNGLLPILILAGALYLAWLVASRGLLAHLRSYSQNKIIIYTAGILLLILIATVYYLYFWRDLDFRYWVDWCVENNRYWREDSIIGAKVRSPFRWLNVLFFTTYIVLHLGLLLGLSYGYQWALSKKENDKNINVKIIKEASLISLIAILLISITENLESYNPMSLFLFIGIAFGHSYMFHKDLLRKPAVDTRKGYNNDLTNFLLVILIISAIVSILFLIPQLNNLSIYNLGHKVGQYSYKVWHLDSIFMSLLLIIITVFLRMLAVKPWQILFREKQAELAGLQAQINPHFLFNALNTLYASAINEDAPKTSEGIQKLSDMMRFMLHENNQHKIDIRQEVTYLKNYIDLQQLRVSGLKDFELKTDLDDTLCLQSIAPMLLVPFVENAFKHGISMRQKSWIDVKLRCDGKKLYFSVFNSFYPKSTNDPERKSSGIGLENVKKRLQLLYPQHHQLTIHQTEREFSVNLEIDV